MLSDAYDMSSPIDDDDSDPLLHQDRTVRDKATASITELKQQLDRHRSDDRPADISLRHRHVDRPADISLRHRSRSADGHGSYVHDHSYGSAVERLREMIGLEPTSVPQKSGSKSVHFPERQRSTTLDDDGHNVRPSHSGTSLVSVPSAMSLHSAASAPSMSTLPSAYIDYLPVPRPIIVPQISGELPTHDLTVPILKNQSVLLQQLEADNKVLKDELHMLRSRVRDVLEENRLLHEELKRSVVHEIMRDGFTRPTSVESVVPTGVSETRPVMSKADHAKWQNELERVNMLHTAKTERLEAQLQYARDEAHKAVLESSALQTRLHALEGLQTADPAIAGLAAGLCVRCGLDEAILPPSMGTVYKQNVDSLTRERDELMIHVSLLKSRCDDVQRRENDAYQQVTHSVQMVEQAQVEMTQALIEREQMREELSNSRSRLEEHITAMQQRNDEERQLIRQEELTAREHLEHKVKELLEKLTDAQMSLEKCLREKTALTTELDLTKGQLNIYDVDYTKETDSMKIAMTQAGLERNLAVQQTMRLRQELDQAEKDRHAERGRLKQELEDVKRRLHQAEKDSLTAKDECLSMHSSNQQLQRELHHARLAKESLERNRGDDLEATAKRAELREAELNHLIDNLQQQHGHSTSELEGLVKSHESLVDKLRDECQRLAQQLEQVTNKYKTANKKLMSENGQMKSQLSRATKRVQDLQDRHLQQSHLQERLRERLQQMDSQNQRCSHQVLDLVTKETALVNDRQLLASHIKFLEGELMSDRLGHNRVTGSRQALVDDVLNRAKQCVTTDDLQYSRVIDVDIETTQNAA